MVLQANDEPTVPYALVEQLFDSAGNQKTLYKHIVNAPFEYPVATAFLFLGFISFFLVDEPKALIRLAGVSDTEYYRLSVADYPFRPSAFTVRLDNADNAIAAAIREAKVVPLHDWGKLRRPRARDEAVRLNQASAGIGYSVLYPLPGTVRGALLYNYFQYQDAIGDDQRDFMKAYTNLVANALAAN
jgi:hypothetical protein